MPISLYKGLKGAQMNQRKKKTAATNCISLAMIDLAEVTEQTWEGICVYRLMPADKPKKDPCIMNHECASWHTQQHRFIRGLKAIQGGDMGCQGRVWWVQGLYIFFLISSNAANSVQLSFPPAIDALPLQHLPVQVRQQIKRQDFVLHINSWLFLAKLLTPQILCMCCPIWLFF